VEHEWCTLVNPDRDLGPQHIHGIRGADVLDAPSFAELAGPPLTMLAGRTLVAHNLAFDLTFLDAEYDRLGVPFPLTRELGLCTMSLASTFLPGAGRSLRECCTAAQIPLTGWHSAMSDAQAAAGLLRHYITVASRLPWAGLLTRAEDVLWPSMNVGPLVPRPRTSTIPQPSPDSSLLARLVDFMPRVDSSELADPYLAVLDEALADRYLSAENPYACGARTCVNHSVPPSHCRHHGELRSRPPTKPRSPVLARQRRVRRFTASRSVNQGSPAGSPPPVLDALERSKGFVARNSKGKSFSWMSS
jgi:DNA polymerase-3 subunit epsilon